MDESRLIFSRDKLIKLVIPMVIEQLLSVTIGMADTIMVASCGEASVSGVALVDRVSLLMTSLLSATAAGGSVVVAQLMGHGDKNRVSAAAKQLFMVVTSMATAFTLIMTLFSSQLIDLLYPGLEMSVRNNAQIYFMILAFSYPFMALYNSGASMFRAVGNSKISMKVSLLSNLMNIGGNALLIIGLKMGVAGAAYSTLASRMMCAFVIIALMQKNPELAIHGKWRFETALVKKIFFVAVPQGVENSLFQIGKLLVSSMTASLGTMVIAANSVCENIANINNIINTAMGMALLTTVGQSIGAGDEVQAKYYVKKLIKVAYIATITIAVILWFAADPICSLYNLSPETAALTVQVLRLNCIMVCFVHPLSFALSNALRAAGDGKFVMVVAMLSMWICRIVFAYILGIQLGFGLMGIWFAMTMDWVVRGVSFTSRIVTGKWTKNSTRITA